MVAVECAEGLETDEEESLWSLLAGSNDIELPIDGIDRDRPRRPQGRLPQHAGGHLWNRLRASICEARCSSGRTSRNRSTDSTEC